MAFSTSRKSTSFVMRARISLLSRERLRAEEWMACFNTRRESYFASCEYSSKASAIWLRQEFPVQRKTMRGIEGIGEAPWTPRRPAIRGTVG